MNVLVIPAEQMPPDVKGSQVDARGFLAEVRESTVEGSLELRCNDSDHSTITMKWIAGGLYRWHGKDYAVFRHFNPAIGDISE